MKQILLLLSIFLTTHIYGYGQDINVWENVGSKKKINKANHTKIKKLKKAKLKLDTLTVDAEEIVLPDFIVKEGEKTVKVKKPKHFKIKHGESEGVLTITEEGVLGTIEGLNITDEGLITPTKNQAVLETDEPVYPPGYNSPEFNIPPPQEQGSQIQEMPTGSAAPLNGKVADILYVTDFDMYVNFGRSAQNITNFVTNLQAAKLVYYNRIGITNRIKEIKILTDTTPYYKLNSSFSVLSQFTTDYQTRTDVDLKHLLTNKYYGGVAYIAAIGRGLFYNTAVSGVYNTLAITNDYSWTIYVVAHEEGHSYGSRHTQWCGWPLSTGGVGRLDSCYSGETYNSYNCGSVIKNPKSGGTIMSYCHLNGTMKLSLGFHPQCASVMQQTLNASSVPGTGNPCTSWSYGPWGPCVNGYQTRTATGTPSGCNSFPTQPTVQACSTGVSLPVVTTTAVGNITTTSVATGGNVTSAGSSSVTARGVVWSTAQNPTVSLTTKTLNGSGVGSYVSSITGLMSNTTYYVRAYATSSAGTSYGTQLTFKTLSAPTNTAIWKCIGTRYAGDTLLIRDGDTSTNNSRWVTTGPSRIQVTLPAARLIPSVDVWSGYLANNLWGSPIANLQVFVDGVQVFTTTTGRVRRTVPVNRTGRVVEIRGNDTQYNRWREIRIN
jgi:hypothetical protein